MAPACWLAKSEPETYSIDDLARDGQTHWEGVRNYMARIHLRNMAVGDRVLFYHSNAEPSGVVGEARVARAAYWDPSAQDPESPYFDPGANEADPRWVMVDLAHVETWPRVVPLEELKSEPRLEGMEVTRKGSRLSVSPVSAEHFARVVEMGHEPAPMSGAVAKTPAAKKRALATEQETPAAAPGKRALAKAAKKKAPKKKKKAPARAPKKMMKKKAPARAPKKKAPARAPKKPRSSDTPR